MGHIIVGAGKSKTHKADQQAGNSGRVSMSQSGEFLLLQELDETQPTDALHKAY